MDPYENYDPSEYVDHSEEDNNDDSTELEPGVDTVTKMMMGLTIHDTINTNNTNNNTHNNSEECSRSACSSTVEHTPTDIVAPLLSSLERNEKQEELLAIIGNNNDSTELEPSVDTVTKMMMGLTVDEHDEVQTAAAQRIEQSKKGSAMGTGLRTSSKKNVTATTSNSREARLIVEEARLNDDEEKARMAKEYQLAEEVRLKAEEEMLLAEEHQLAENARLKALEEEKQVEEARLKAEAKARALEEEIRLKAEEEAKALEEEIRLAEEAKLIVEQEANPPLVGHSVFLRTEAIRQMVLHGCIDTQTKLFDLKFPLTVKGTDCKKCKSVFNLHGVWCHHHKGVVPLPNEAGE